MIFRFHGERWEETLILLGSADLAPPVPLQPPVTNPMNQIPWAATHLHARVELGSRPRARGLARRDARRFDHSSMSQTASLA